MYRINMDSGQIKFNITLTSYNHVTKSLLKRLRQPTLKNYLNGTPNGENNFYSHPSAFRMTQRFLKTGLGNSNRPLRARDKPI